MSAHTLRHEPPPLARGRLAVQDAGRPGLRTTPAGAGPTTASPPRSPPGTNHPRWRGADSRRIRSTVRRAEPPPLARGRHVSQIGELLGARTTPAGAGPTGPAYADTVPKSNHPRWRGADARPGRGRSPRREPPPLARGRPGDGVRDRAARGTTPAGAGPTRRPYHQHRQPANHPRWRGADWPGSAGRVQGLEPPPLARGRLSGLPLPEADRGTTPAGAGPTRRISTPPCGPTNHPRWRGADAQHGAALAWLDEPPPLARGRRALEGGRPTLVRTTPAGAGPTPSRP